MRYRRVRLPGATYFFTLVTHDRKPLLVGDNVALFEQAVAVVRSRHPFDIDAAVILPNHIHALWTLPDGDSDYPKRWSLIKQAFTRALEHRSLATTPIWQNRYWEHTIRDERDFAAHVEYIHFNPVKHGLVHAPKDWAHSTFHAWVATGSYDLAWGADAEPAIPDGVGRE